MKTDNKLQTTRNLVLAMVFILIITIQFWWPLTGIADAEKSELRPLAEEPGGYIYETFEDLSVYAARFENYFVDSFPLRYHLIRFDKNIRYAVFEEKVYPDVIIGESDWLYWNSPRNTRACQQERPFPIAALMNWGRIYQELEVKLKDRDIDLYFHIPPAKCSIYPEYMGDQLVLLDVNNRLDQYLAYMEEQDIGIPIIDNRSSLLAEKPNAQVYYRTDTHWNDFGAYIGYRDIIQTIFPDIQEEDLIQVDDLKVYHSSEPSGSLSSYLAIEGRFDEDLRILKLETETTMVEDGIAHIYTNPSAPNDLTLLVFHDSFYNSKVSGLMPALLAEHFQRAIFLDRNRGSYWNPESEELMALLDEWQPDILLVERTERNINAFALGDPFQGE